MDLELGDPGILHGGFIGFHTSISGELASSRGPVPKLVAAGTHLRCKAHLQLDLGLRNILLAATTTHNLLRLGDLCLDGLGTEVLQRVPFNGVDAQGGLGLDDSEATGNCNALRKPRAPRFKTPSRDVRKNRLLLPFSSITSTTPGFSCSIDGTWLARTPISPDSAGMLTWTTSWDW
jgi:hypothetical protein